MYKLIFIISMLFCAGNVSAQLIQIDSVQDNSIGALQKSANGDVLMTYYVNTTVSGKKDKAQLVIKRAGFKQTEATTATVEIEKAAVVLKAAVSQTGYCFLMNDVTTKHIYLMSVDVSGGVVKKADINGVEADQLSWDNDIKLISSFPEGYVLVTPATNKKGFWFRLYNNDLNETFSKEYNTNGEAEIVNAVQNMESVVVLIRELTDAKQQRNVYTVYSINTIDVSRTQTTVLKDDNNNYCYATVLKNMEGSLCLAGLSYKDGKYVPGIPSGVSIFEMMPDGNLGRKVYLEGSALVKFLPDATINTISENGMLVIEDVAFEMSQNKYHIVCELLSKKQLNAKLPDAQLKMSDMMTITANTEGEIEKLSIVKNPPSLNITLKGPATKRMIYSTAHWLQKNDLYNLRFTARLGDTYYLCVKSADSAKRKADAVVMQIDNPDADGSFSLTMQRLPTKTPMLKISDRYTIVSGIVDNKIKAWQHADIIYLMGENVALWNQEEDKISIQFEALVPVRGR